MGVIPSVLESSLSLHAVLGCCIPCINTSTARQIGHHFPDCILELIFFNENIEFDWYFIEVCYVGSNWQYSSTDSDHRLVLSRRQAIIWINDGRLPNAHMRHSDPMS